VPVICPKGGSTKIFYQKYRKKLLKYLVVSYIFCTFATQTRADDKGASLKLKDAS
jgi:hypothetical protein